MATKKQKHARAVAKREEFMKQLKIDGQKALRRSHELRRIKERKAWQQKHDKEHTWKKMDPKCPICSDRMKGRVKPAEPKKLFDDEADKASDLSRPQTGPFPDVDYGPTTDLELPLQPWEAHYLETGEI